MRKLFSRKLIFPLVFVGLICIVGIYIFLYPAANAGSTELPAPVLSNNETALFAVIGDFGSGGEPEEDVSNLVKSWDPDFIVTVGDNNYSNFDQVTMEKNIGQYYSEYITTNNSSESNGIKQNRFFPALGNHDWDSILCIFDSCRGVYFEYFTLPGNELYYDFIWGPVHFFMVDSDPREPDGNSADSVQGTWLKGRLMTSTSSWNVVVTHFPPYSSGKHGSTDFTQLPYKVWGADVVMSGHDHIYERILVDDLTYIVNGLGGKSPTHQFTTTIPGIQVRFNQDYGAMLVEADQQTMTIKFIARTGELVDEFTLPAN